MKTLSEIEIAVKSLPREEQAELMKRLSAKLRPRRLSTWPVPPPDVSPEEIRRIQAEIDATFDVR